MLFVVSTLEPRKNVAGTAGCLRTIDREQHARRIATPPDLVLAGKVTDEALEWLKPESNAPAEGTCEADRLHRPDAHPRSCDEAARVLVLPSFEEGSDSGARGDDRRRTGDRVAPRIVTRGAGQRRHPG